MKKIIKSVMGCLLALLLVACNSDNTPGHETALSEFAFLTSNINRDLTQVNAEPVRLEWEASSAENSTVVFYRVQFSNKKDGFSNPSYELRPNRLGMDTHIEINDSVLNIAAEMAGVRQSVEGTFYCSVLASNGVSCRAVSGEPIEFKVKRPDGFAAIPPKMYVQHNSGYTRMKVTTSQGGNPVAFDLVLEFKAGEKVAIVDSKTGYQRHFSLTAEQQLQELYEGNFEIEIPADGVYHVGVNFLTKEAIFAKVDKVDLVVVRNNKPDDVVTTLDYDGEYVWNKDYTALLSDGSALPVGASYKFRFAETSVIGSIPVTAYWGHSADKVNPPNDQTTEDYFYITRVPEGVTNFYRYPAQNLSGQKMQVVLMMNPEAENYSHTNQVLR